MGEGDPGRSLERAFYDTAREVTEAHGSFLIVDSIQAGLRAQGVLSIIDYPGFSDCLPPDMEIYSKALNGGQFPLSLLALRDRAASEYIAGTYGNTMTANPRALDVASVVLDSCTDELARNVREKGAEFVTRLKELQRELPEAIVSVQGTGLLVSAKLHENIPVVGVDGAEQRLRKRGINVIHGGVNSLRYTPWLSISSEEISLIVEKTGGVLRTLAKENSLT
ncbi:aminotransferase class III-fold pyridoxal phosphate-dependent enzyme [bacterium]|nr:aminotransferase class III-fold pyridoxal phosphate-dependent enzyme [bacterium]